MKRVRSERGCHVIWTFPPKRFVAAVLQLATRKQIYHAHRDCKRNRVWVRAVIEGGMSASGQKPTLQSDRRMSVLPPKADVRVTRWHVYFGPLSDSCAATKSAFIIAPRSSISGIYSGDTDRFVRDDPMEPICADLSTILNRILDTAADNLRIAKILVQMGLDPNKSTGFGG